MKNIGLHNDAYELDDVTKLIKSWVSTNDACIQQGNAGTGDIEFLKSVFDRAKKVEVEGLLMLQILRKAPDPADVVTRETAELLLPAKIKMAAKVCKTIIKSDPRFALR